jgi:hypothetical protein
MTKSEKVENHCSGEGLLHLAIDKHECIPVLPQNFSVCLVKFSSFFIHVIEVMVYVFNLFMW